MPFSSGRAFPDENAALMHNSSNRGIKLDLGGNAGFVILLVYNNNVKE